MSEREQSQSSPQSQANQGPQPGASNALSAAREQAGQIVDQARRVIQSREVSASQRKDRVPPGTFHNEGDPARVFSAPSPFTVVDDTRFRYVARTGGREFEFEFEPRFDGANWRLYIVRQPDYEGRVATANVSHRLHDAGGAFVCWTGAVPTLEQAEALAIHWADHTAGYIVRGYWSVE